MAKNAEISLAKRLKAKDPAAMNELVDLHGGKIYNLAIGILKNQHDAEDVLQETLLQVFEKIDSFREEAALSSWMYRIALNFAYMKIRKGKRNDYIPLDEYMPKFRKDGMHKNPVQAWTDKTERNVLTKETGKLLRESIDGLSDKYRIVLTLRDIEGFSTEEVADMTGMTISAVKSRLHRARLFLREVLSDHYND